MGRCADSLTSPATSHAGSASSRRAGNGDVSARRTCTDGPPPPAAPRVALGARPKLHAWRAEIRRPSEGKPAVVYCMVVHCHGARGGPRYRLMSSTCSPRRLLLFLSFSLAPFRYVSRLTHVQRPRIDSFDVSGRFTSFFLWV